MSALAVMLEQFTTGRSPERGWPALVVILVLLLLGGIYLLVHAFIDLYREQKAMEREEEEERDKKKAA